jgi:hypothetical protein
MSKATETRVPCSKDTRERLWNAKRGGESFDVLFQKMLEQYDPEDAYDGTKTKSSV